MIIRCGMTPLLQINEPSLCSKIASDDLVCHKTLKRYEESKNTKSMKDCDENGFEIMFLGL